ncbi:MAG TPA: IS21-like element helper ATPase IstB [Acidimicrobiales bacterium]|nr:IS21-like element helper ATPase IstB [Acidimicrobiales bacterium]
MTTPTDTAALAAIDAATRELHLPGIRDHAGRLATQAQRTKATYLGFLADVLGVELDDRAERRRTRRIHEAHFPRLKRLADFNFDVAPTINPATIANLAAGGYLDAGDPVVLLGDSGTGKTHLLIALGVAACEQGRRVRYATCAQLVNELVEAADERRLARLVARYGRHELLLIDEVGYVQLDARGAELLFQVLTEREEKSSIGLASNLPFSEWGQIITDARLVAAVIDRVTFNAHIIETGTDSYRHRTSRTRRSRTRRDD